jgi:anti-anti-sigma factor
VTRLEAALQQQGGVGGAMHTTRSELVRDRVVLEVDGPALGDDAEWFRRRMRELVLSGTRVIVVDLDGVDRLASSVVEVLLSTHRTCRSRGGYLVVRTPRRQARGLRRSALGQVFRCEGR